MTEAALRTGRWTAVGIGCWAGAVAVMPGALRAVILGSMFGAALCYALIVDRRLWTVVFLASALLLPPLPLALGDSGPHPSLLFAAAGLLAGLVHLRATGPSPDRKLALAFAILFGILLASMIPAALYSGAEVVAGSLARLALFGIALYVFFYTSGSDSGAERNDLRPVRFIYWMAVAAALFACVDFYFQFPAPAGFGPQFVWLDSGVYRRAQGLFYEASTLGNFCAFFLVMSLVALVRRPGGFVTRSGLLFGGACFLIALVLSFSRASLLNVVTACCALAWMERLRPSRRVLVALMVVGGATLIVALTLFPAFAGMYWLRISASFEYLLSAPEGVLSGRVASWRSLLEIVQQNPLVLLFGIGYKTLPYTFHFGDPVIADNMYLSMLVETGVGGLAALLWLHVAILGAARRASRDRDPQTAFLGAWMLCFWCGEMVQMLSGDLLTYWRVLGLYFWVLALAVRRTAARSAA